MKKITPISFLFFFSLCATIFAQTPPIANNDSDATEFNTALNTNAPGVLANDTDTESDPLGVTQFIVNGTTYTT